MQLFLIVMFLLNFSKTKTTDSENLKKAVSGFFFTMPKTLLSGKNETVCLSSHYSSSSQIKIIVDLKIKEHHFFTINLIDSEHSCFNIWIPSNKSEPQVASVRVQIQLNTNGTIYSAHNQDPIIIYPNKKVTFIETDRFTYKSKDTVKFRILTLGENLLPQQNYRLPYVKIRNPQGVGVVVWENISTELGLLQLEYALSQDALEGKWKIETLEETKIFQVSKYVLPRFKVYILHPKILYYKVPSVTLKVCAKYAFGGNVSGTAFIRLTDSYHNMRMIQALKKMTAGCAEFIFLQNELGFSNIRKKFPFNDPRVVVHITATVTEYGTDKIELTTAKSLILLKAYNIKFMRKNMFLPGLVYEGVIQLNNVNIDLIGEVIEICYNVAIKKSWNYINKEHCSNFSVGNERSIPFTILPLKNNVIHFQLNARSLNHTNIGDSLLVVRLYSASASYIMLNQIQNSDMSKCQSTQQFAVHYTTDKFQEHENVTFYYMIKSRGQIFTLRKIIHNVRKHYSNYTHEYKNIVGTPHRFSKPANSLGKFILKFKLDKNIVSDYQLLVYYLTYEGEIISAAENIIVEPCINNEVKVNWSQKQVLPGQTASLSLETKQPSLCSVSAVDKATTFIDDLDILNMKKILTPFLKEKETPQSARKSCIPPTKKHREVAALIETEEKVWDLNRKKRFVYSFSEDYDAYDIFNKFGVITITNFRVVTKPCYTGPIPSTNDPGVQFLTDQYHTQNEESIVSIRSFFPETWLWELVPVRGIAVIHRNAPHTVTNWITNVLCVSATDGVSFSKTTEISTFQPFFLHVLTPHSLKRGETLYLHAMVFNFLTYNIPIRVSLGTSHGLTEVDVLNRKSFSFCLTSNSTITHVFDLKAVEVGQVNITVLAEIDPTFPGHCGPDVLIDKRDVVFKTLIVEPEGYPVQLMKSALLCGSDQLALNNITWQLTVPGNIVSQTAKAKVVVSGDILGEALQNFDNLITMPTGCGEQIMATLAPNLYILKYLNGTRQLTPAIRHRIIRNLKIGYQRILNYVHKDGSFSAFGYHDPLGSTFLTSFVVRTLRDAKQYIYVDQKIIDRAVSWIVSNQLENGCFDTMLHVFQDMGGTSTENSTAGLTAYVMISLLDADVDIPESVKTNAKYCIRGHYYHDKYSLAISSYALFKVGWYSEADRMLKKLLQISNQKDNMMWWTNKEIGSSSASDIEITSYVLLSLLYQRTQENLARAHSVVRWLSTKQGVRGGFKSTQDTVVALDALARYSYFVSFKRTNLNISVTELEQRHTFEINDDDRLKSKRINLKRVNNTIKINVQGSGCIVARTVVSYFVKHVSNSEAFKLEMEVSSVSNIDQCSIATLSPCITYNGPDPQSNMAILEVDLPSGYEADKSSLYKLTDENSTSVKKFEELEQKVVLYLTKLSSKQVCINFNINEHSVVHSRLNSTIKVYDYYKPEHSVIHFYKINDKCKFNTFSIPNLAENNRNNTSSESTKNKVKRNTIPHPDFTNIHTELTQLEGTGENVPSHAKHNSTNLKICDSMDSEEKLNSCTINEQLEIQD